MPRKKKAVEEPIEKFDNPTDLETKIQKLAKLIKESKHVVIHAGKWHYASDVYDAKRCWNFYLSTNI